MRPGGVLAVTPNPALDVTYRVPQLVPGRVHRVAEMAVRAGGKGVNVARVLHRLGAPCAVLGLGGGPGGARLAAELEADGLDVRLVDALPDVRRTVVVHGADGVTTSLWEPGPPPHDAAKAERLLLDSVLTGLPDSGAVTVSGSLPVGVDPELPLRVAALCAEHDVPVVLDLDGAPLRAAATAGGAVLMPNEDELAALTGERPDTPADAARLATALLHTGPTAVVVATLGARGIVAVGRAGAVHARLPSPVQGNPTGAGDAACAAVARALARAGSAAALDLRRMAVDAVAVSAASVLRPVAGDLDLAAYRRLTTEIVVEDPCR
ncbi:hexose kinase [Actinocorallia sp. API 0066]|uniref:1-phosphofructokinase family hexose kinase n=1 Tax=Actinocorallia sp. API 0066 TaxID=2896846 RepID=UPI001E4009DD|nr:hexose kinase [Actinocorallia sp. API 0066]MCD0448030.1 hexose kinase [Actinocorallia sp. API 0066]